MHGLLRNTCRPSVVYVYAVYEASQVRRPQSLTRGVSSGWNADKSFQEQDYMTQPKEGALVLDAEN